MGEGKLCFPAWRAQQEERDQVAKAKGCCPAVQVVRLGLAFELSLARFLRLEKTLMVRQVILGDQTEVTADDDRTLPGKAFDRVNGGRPRFLRFSRGDGNKGNRDCLGPWPPERSR